MPSGFHHAALAVSDTSRAVSFYDEVLDFDLIGPDDPERSVETADYVWLAVGDGQWLNLANRPAATPDRSAATDDPHLAFRATEAEIEAVERRLDDRGVSVEHSPTSIYFRDPDGNLLELTRWSGPDPARR